MRRHEHNHAWPAYARYPVIAQGLVTAALTQLTIDPALFAGAKDDLASQMRAIERFDAFPVIQTFHCVAI
jgi:hypothetical protein